MSVVRLLPAWLHAVADYAVGLSLIVVAVVAGGAGKAVAPGVVVGAVVLIVGWAISLLVIGLVLRFGTGAEALAWGVMFVLLPLSGVFYPIDALPTVLQPVAQALPTTHAFDALRGLVDGTGLDWVQVGIAAVG